MHLPVCQEPFLGLPDTGQARPGRNGVSGLETRPSPPASVPVDGMRRVDLTLMTTHSFGLDEMAVLFKVAEKRLEDVVKVQIRF